SGGGGGRAGGRGQWRRCAGGLSGDAGTRGRVLTRLAVDAEDRAVGGRGQGGLVQVLLRGLNGDLRVGNRGLLGADRVGWRDGLAVQRVLGRGHGGCRRVDRLLAVQLVGRDLVLILGDLGLVLGDGVLCLCQRLLDLLRTGLRLGACRAAGGVVVGLGLVGCRLVDVGQLRLVGSQGVRILLVGQADLCLRVAERLLGVRQAVLSLHHGVAVQRVVQGGLSGGQVVVRLVERRLERRAIQLRKDLSL